MGVGALRAHLLRWQIGRSVDPVVLADPKTRWPRAARFANRAKPQPGIFATSPWINYAPRFSTRRASSHLPEEANKGESCPTGQGPATVNTKSSLPLCKSQFVWGSASYQAIGRHPQRQGAFHSVAGRQGRVLMSFVSLVSTHFIDPPSTTRSARQFNVCCAYHLLRLPSTACLRSLAESQQRL